MAKKAPQVESSQVLGRSITWEEVESTLPYIGLLSNLILGFFQAASFLFMVQQAQHILVTPALTSETPQGVLPVPVDLSLLFEDVSRHGVALLGAR